MPRAACDGCHRRKERCLFDASERCCRQCRLQRTRCSFERRSRRMGRPPVAQKVPYGNCGILSFETHDEQQPGQAVTPVHANCAAPSAQDDDTESIGWAGIQNIQNIMGVENSEADETDEAGESEEMDPPWHTQHTTFETDETDAAEEADLGVATCETTDVDDDAETNNLAKLVDFNSCNNTFRPPWTFGYSLADLFTLVEALYGYSLPLQLHSPERPLVTIRHQHVHRVLSDQQTFYTYHRHFMIGPSFSDSFRGAITVVFARSGGVLLEAYMAALALWDDQHDRVKSLDEVNPREGSNCLKKLQAAAVMDAHDAAAVIMLGQVLVVYHIMLLGTSAHPILRQSLLLVKDWYPSLLAEPCLRPITVTAILLDTVECLVKREIPIIQPPHGNLSAVDRTFGLCSDLICILYDICVLSHEVKMSACTGSVVSENPTHFCPRNHGKELADIESRVRGWEPAPPTTFYNQFSPLEVSAMMLQARVYRLATLLVIHRLQYPLGVEDDTAVRLAMNITAELECFIEWVPAEIKRLPIGLPVLVSSLEIDSPSERVIKYVSPITAGDSGYAMKLKGFASLVKAARDNGYRGLWFDLVQGGLHIPVLP